MNERSDEPRPDRGREADLAAGGQRSPADGADPTERRSLGLALGIGAATVVVVELVMLVRVALGPGEAFEQAAIWAVLLMITVTFLTVGGIGYGFYRDRTRGTDGDGDG